MDFLALHAAWRVGLKCFAGSCHQKSRHRLARCVYVFIRLGNGRHDLIQMYA